MISLFTIFNEVPTHEDERVMQVFSIKLRNTLIIMPSLYQEYEL